MATNKATIKSAILSALTDHRASESALVDKLKLLYKEMEGAPSMAELSTASENYAISLAEVIRDAVTTNEDSVADKIADAIQDAIQSADITGVTTEVASSIPVEVENTGDPQLYGDTTAPGSGSQTNTVNPV
jgi:hypothetical protein